MSTDGNTVAVGAYRESGGSFGVNGDESPDSTRRFSGACYVYTRVSGVWSQHSYIKGLNLVCLVELI